HEYCPLRQIVCPFFRAVALAHQLFGLLYFLGGQRIVGQPKSAAKPFDEAPYHRHTRQVHMLPQRTYRLDRAGYALVAQLLTSNAQDTPHLVVTHLIGNGRMVQDDARLASLGRATDLPLWTS